MKKITIIIALTVSALMFFACKKYPELKVYKVEFGTENVVTTTSSADITVEYTYPSKLDSVNAYLSTTNDFQSSIVVKAEVSKDSFVVRFSNLQANTTYYYQFEYSNGVNEALRTGIKSFVTIDGGGGTANLPTVTTNSITDITNNSATCGGNVTNDGGATVTARGVCWSTAQNPTTNDSHTTNGAGTGSFTSELIGLNENTLYYVRAYATNEVGTAYGNEISFTTQGNQPGVPTGAINGLFTINENGDQVYFSQGNLQYIGSATTPYWRFAEHQWDYLGNTTNQNSTDPNVDRDLFGWGCSGYNHGAVCYQPWNINNQINSDYYAYGSYTYNLNDQTGQADWGYNAISNGGNTINTWRTLTSNEWTYLFNNRSTISGIRYAKACIIGTNGVILLPDDWSTTIYSLNNTNTISSSFNTNIINSTEWELLENAGAVFLPAAGGIWSTFINGLREIGVYWSASYKDSEQAHRLYYRDAFLNPEDFDNRRCSFSVRLVQDAE